MKKIIYVILSVFPLFTYAQIDVISDGSVGVGTDQPTAQLHIKGPGNINGASPLGVILEDAKLGIGVTSSKRSLHVRGKTGVIQIDRNANSPAFILSKYNSDYSGVHKTFGLLVYGEDTDNDLTTDEGYVAFTDFHNGVGGNSDRRFVIDNDGSMIVNGVGLNDSPYTLHVFGNAAKTDGLSDWTIPSDKRLKKNVKNYKKGLDVILKMRPVSYEYNGKAGTQAGTTRIGVLAQELQKIAPSMVEKYTHIDSGDNGVEYIDGKPEHLKFKRTEEEYLSINTSELKWTLVNAIKEQQKVIDSQKEEIETLREEMTEIKEMMQTVLNTQSTDINQQQIQLDGRDAYLEQNQPNPFNGNTLIKYHVPTEAKQAIVNIFDINGQLIHSESITRMGTGEIQIKAGTITAGTYSYSLVIDGKVLDTKKMVLVR